MIRNLKRALPAILALGLLAGCEEDEPLLQVSYSPEGRRLAVIYEKHIDMYVRLDDGTTSGAGSVDAVGKDGVCWLREEEGMVYSSRQEGSEDLWRHRPGHEPERLTQHEARDFWPMRAPGSAEIIFASTRAGHIDFYRLPLDTRKIERVAQLAQDQISPSLSPDGRYLFCISYERLRPEPCLIDVQGGAKQWMEGFLEEGEPTPDFVKWSRDSKSIYYTIYNGDHSVLYRYDPAVKERKSLKRFKGPLRDFMAPKQQNQAAVVDAGGRAWRFRLKDKAGLLKRRLKLEGFEIDRLDFSPDQQRLVFSTTNVAGTSKRPFKKITPLYGPDNFYESAWHQRFVEEGDFNRVKQAFNNRVKVAGVAQKQQIELEFLNLMLEDGRYGRALNKALKLSNDSSLSTKTLAQLHELRADVEFDIFQRFGDAWRHYQRAQELMQSIGEDWSSARYEILKSDDKELIEAWADYYQAQRREKETFSPLLDVLKVAPYSEQALRKLVEAAQSDKQRERATEMVMSVGAPTLENLGALLNMKNVDAARSFFRQHFDELMAEDDFRNTWAEVIAELALPVPFENDELYAEGDDSIVQFLNSDDVLSLLASQFDTPELQMLFLLALTRLALQEPNEDKVVNVTLADREALQQLDENSSNTAFLEMCFYMYAGEAYEYNRKYGHAAEAYRRAWRRAVPAYKTWKEHGEQYIAKSMSKADWRAIRVWIDARIALLSAVDALGNDFRRYLSRERKLRLHRFKLTSPRQEIEDIRKRLLKIEVEVDDPHLPALVNYSIGRCHEYLGNNYQAAAFYRLSLAFKPMGAVQLLCWHRLSILAEKWNDPYLQQMAFNNIRSMVPDDPIFQELFRNDEE